MTIASKTAFNKGHEKRQTHKQIILAFYQNRSYGSFTYIVASSRTGLSIATCQKRCSDLYKEGLLIIVPPKEGEYFTHSLYQFGESKPKLTKTEMIYKAIETVCPMFLDEIKREYEKECKG